MKYVVTLYGEAGGRSGCGHPFNPCAHIKLPKVIKRKARTLTPAEDNIILASLRAQHRMMVETAINTGLLLLPRARARHRRLHPRPTAERPKRCGLRVCLDVGSHHSSWSEVDAPAGRLSVRARTSRTPVASTHTIQAK
jgi:hypothetical protein